MFDLITSTTKNGAKVGLFLTLIVGLGACSHVPLSTASVEPIPSTALEPEVPAAGEPATPALPPPTAESGPIRHSRGKVLQAQHRHFKHKTKHRSTAVAYQRPTRKLKISQSKPATTTVARQETMRKIMEPQMQPPQMPQVPMLAGTVKSDVTNGEGPNWWTISGIFAVLAAAGGTWYWRRGRKLNLRRVVFNS